MQNAFSIVVLALAGAGLSVVFATVALVVIVSVVFLLTGGSGSAYDQIGAGGLSVEGDHAPPQTADPLASPAASSSQGEREREIRQMLGARSERLVRRGQPALDVEAELARLLALERPPRAHDAALVAEVRALVTARNERRVRQGLEPLDVDGEVARTLEELEP